MPGGAIISIGDETTAPMDPTYVDLILAGFESQFTDAAAPGIIIPSGVLTTADIAPGTVPSSGLVVDAASGVATSVVPDASGIPPLLPAPMGTGSIVNPAWVQHLYQLKLDKLVPAIHYIPPPDTVTIFTGPGEGPTWNDVYAWTTAEQRAKMTFVLDTAPVTGAQLQAAIDTAIGSVIKSMGGLVDQSVALTATIARVLDHRIDALQLATYKGVIGTSLRVDKLAAEVDAILKLAIPNLQAQIDLEEHNRKVDVIRHDEATREYVHDVWVKPLRSDLALETQQRKLADQSIIERVPDIVRSLAPELTAALAATVASVATRVGTLEDEATRCGRPMCAVMGPGTDLFKLLKLIKWAALAALLLELGALTADDVNGLIGKLGHEVASAMSTFDELFVSGGESIAHTLIDAAARVV